MSIPTYQEFMLPVLKTAKDGEISIGTIVKKLSDDFELNDEQRAELLPSGKQTVVANRIHWARTYLVQAGLLEPTKRAHIKASERGLRLLRENPQSIDKKMLEEFPEFQAFLNRKKSDDDNNSPDAPTTNITVQSTETPDEIMRAAHKDVEDALRSELLDKLRSSSPAFFEGIVVNLLVAMGYGGSLTDAGKAIGRSGDGGIDGVIDQDALGLDRVYIQAKRYDEGNNVGAGAIRDFFGSLDRYKATKGVFVTTSRFTQDAVQTVEMLSKHIVLIDNVTLTKLMVRYNVGCRVEDTLVIRRIDEDFFSD